MRYGFTDSWAVVVCWWVQEDREKEQTKREAEWRRKGELRRQFRCVNTSKAPLFFLLMG